MFQTVHVHNNLALALCDEILKDVVAYEDIGLDVNYLKALLQLQLSLDDEAFTEEIRAVSEKIQKVGFFYWHNLLYFFHF